MANELGMNRILLRALLLLLVLPSLTVFYLFREHLQGKILALTFLFILSACGFYLLWSMARAIGSFRTGLRAVASGRAVAIRPEKSPTQMREMVEIINDLNTLTENFRKNTTKLDTFIHQSATLAEISEVTAKVPDIHELLKLVLAKAAAATQARRGTIMLLQEDGETMEVVAVEGWISEQPNQLVQVESTLAGRVVKSGRPLLVEDIDEAPELRTQNRDSVYSSPSFLIMPLNTKTGTIGTLCLSERSTGGAFNSNNQQFLTALLGQIGYAIENASLLKQAREMAIQLKQTVIEQKKVIGDTQQQVIQAEKLTALGQLAGGVAHDFNNLLQAITGYCDLARRRFPESDKGQNYLDQAGKATQRAAKLTSQLLAFGRRQTLQPRYLTLNKVIDELLNMLNRLLGENVELETVLDADLRTVHADPSQVEQVLMNLCINARDAMPEGGSITFETGNVLIDQNYCAKHPWAQPGPYVRVSVTDTGIGMDGNTMNQIFEPFFTTKEEGKGTGLGLATVYGIVRQHCGFIDVTSEVQQGTTFNIYLPEVNHPVDQAAPEKLDHESVVAGRETILVAEDNEFVREWGQQIMADAGYTVLAAADGEEAVQLFEEHADEIGLALLDVVMPKLNGMEVCSRLKRAKPDVGILFCSGYSAEIIPPDYLAENGFQLILKPFEPFDLLKKVREILDTPPGPVMSSIPGERTFDPPMG
jgi:signal transduction histidine kinase